MQSTFHFVVRHRIRLSNYYLVEGSWRNTIALLAENESKEAYPITATPTLKISKYCK